MLWAWMVHIGLFEEVQCKPDFSVTGGEALQIGGKAGWETGVHMSREAMPGPWVERRDWAD